MAKFGAMGGLFKVQEERWSRWSILLWWEARRPVYNAIMVGAILLSLGLLCFFIGEIGSREARQQPFESIAVFFGFIAMNVCYTAGWVVEIIATAGLPQRCPDTAPAFLRAGLAFSLFIVFAPTALWGFGWLLSLLGVLAP